MEHTLEKAAAEALVVPNLEAVDEITFAHPAHALVHVLVVGKVVGLVEQTKLATHEIMRLRTRRRFIGSNSAPVEVRRVELAVA